MVRIVLIGCGSHSRVAHGPALGRVAAERPGEIELAGVCDLDRGRAEAFCREFGFARAYTDWREMVRVEKPDGCVAVMPVERIAAVAEELLERGLPCVIEKPMGASLAEVRRLWEVAKRKGTRHMVSVNRRFLPALNRAMGWAGERGAVKFLRGAMLRVKRTESDFAWGTGMHLVDALRHIAGEVAEFRVASPGGAPTAGRWFAGDLQFAGGAVGHLEILPTAGVEEEVYELMGEGFRVQVVSQQFGGTAVRGWDGGNLAMEQASGADEPAFVMRGEYAETCEFVDALRDGRAPRPAIGDVLASAELCARMMGW